MSSTNPAQHTFRRWRVAVSVRFPGRIEYPPGEDPTKGPPSQLIPASRFAGRQSGRVGDYVLTLDRDANGPPMTIQSLWEPLLLTLDVESADTQAALDVARAPVERVLDDFMFRLQSPVLVGQVSVIDTTPPVAIGQEASVRGWDQAGLARAAGVSEATVSRAFGGKTVRSATALRLALALKKHPVIPELESVVNRQSSESARSIAS